MDIYYVCDVFWKEFTEIENYSAKLFLHLMTFDPYYDPLKGKPCLLTPLDVFRTQNHTRKVRLNDKGLMK